MRLLRILSYHKIGEPPVGAPSTVWYIPEHAFRMHLRYLSEHAWDVLSAELFLRGLVEPDTLPERAALLTFDDGYKTMLTKVVPCLREFGYPSVAFIPTRYVGGHNDWDMGREPPEPICTWEDLRELERRGCSIQSHSVTHPLFDSLSPQQQDDELRQSKMLIETELNKTVEMFAYPYGRTGRDPTVLAQAVQRAGYRAAFIFPGGVAHLPTQDVYLLPRIPMYASSDIAVSLA